MQFYRGSNQNIQGGGLGLSIVKRIAERHGAQVELDTGLEKTGLCIRVIFPNTPEVL
jgi:Signal transduction histidine kinase involved in nitrogen fixation and metabolism regulation